MRKIIAHTCSADHTRVGGKPLICLGPVKVSRNFLNTTPTHDSLEFMKEVAMKRIIGLGLVALAVVTIAAEKPLPAFKNRDSRLYVHMRQFADKQNVSVSPYGFGEHVHYVRFLDGFVTNRDAARVWTELHKQTGEAQYKARLKPYSS